MSSGDSVILEHLAATAWFIEHGEVAVTAGLAFCLEKDSGAAGAFIELIRERTNRSETEIPVPARWQAEFRDDQGNRPDVTGWLDTTPSQAPVVVVEAKFSADFLPQQVASYVGSQQRRLVAASTTLGALAVLVPAIRVHSARAEVGADLARLGATEHEQWWDVEGEASVRVTVISWDEAIDAMAAKAESAGCDLDQLRGACRALQGADVTALTESDLRGGWRSRKDDVRLIVDRVSRAAITELTLPRAPWQSRAFDGLDGGFRYLAPSDLPNLAVGMRVDGQDPPFWARWHRRTADLALAESRLSAAGYAVQRNDDGLWLPLELRPDAGAATRQIASLVSQVVQLYKTAVAWTEPI